MSVTKIEINGKDYKIECKAGEEKLLFNAVNMINGFDKQISNQSQILYLINLFNSLGEHLKHN